MARAHVSPWLVGAVIAVVLPAATASGQAGPQGAPAPEREESVATAEHGDQRPSHDDYARFRNAARSSGRVRVIIGLRTAFTPDGALSDERRTAQRGSIERETEAVRRALAGSGHKVLHTYETLPYVAAEVSAEALDQLEAAGVAASIQEDILARPALAESRVIVEANELPAVQRTGAGQTVAVLDTGVEKTHPFLQQGAKAKVVSEACFSDGDCPGNTTSSTAAGSGVPCTYAAACGHGTHVAGIAVGRGSSFSGIARDAKLISVQVYSRFDGPSDCGGGEDPCALSFASDQLAGLQRVYALRNTFPIAAVLLSASGGQFTSACDGDPLKAAIDNLRSARIATVVPSGNDGFTNAVGAPGCISTAVTVGATTKSDVVGTFSNSSSLVDLFAPGVGITSSVVGGGFGAMTGTSQAAAHVAGALAVIKQVDPAYSVTRAQVALETTGKPVTDTLASPQITRDRIRVLAASAHRQQTGFGSTSAFALAGGGIASNGVGLARRTGANQSPTSGALQGTIALSGIPQGAATHRAWLVWQTVGGPDSRATFRQTTRVGKLVGASGQFNCWSTNGGGAVRTYVYEVPPSEITGNKNYAVGGIGGNELPTGERPDGQGASLVVAYRVPGAPSTGRAYLRFGSMTARPGEPAVEHTFSGLTVPANVTGRALHIGMGDGEPFADPAMQFAGSNVTGSDVWSGTDGRYWDDIRRSIAAALLPQGATSRVNRQGATGECLTWAYAGLTYQHP